MKVFTLIILFLFLVSPLNAQETAETYFQKGSAAEQQGKTNDAIKLYEKALELNWEFVPAYVALGKIHEQRTTDVEAVAWYYKSALDIEPNNVQIHESLARWYQQMSQFDLAEKHFKKILEITPDSLSAEYSLAWLYLMGKSNPHEAVNRFNRVLERSKIPMAYYGLGIAYGQAGEQARVLEVVTELKSLGQMELASKLESSVRQPWTPQPQTVRVPVTNPASGIVKSPQPQAPAPAAATPTATMPVRLRGKLYPIDPKSNPSNPAPSSGGY